MVFFHKSQTWTLCASLLVNQIFSKKLSFKLFTVWFLRYFNKSYASSGSCWTWTILSSSWKSYTWCPHIPHIWQWTLPPVTGQIYGWCPKTAGQTECFFLLTTYDLCPLQDSISGHFQNTGYPGLLWLVDWRERRLLKFGACCVILCCLLFIAH